jgi:drug/metabolite transporter (DMT)-like permease
VSKLSPPVTFAGLSTLLAAIVALVYATIQGRLHELRYKKAYQSLLVVAFCIVIIPSLLFFIGAFFLLLFARIYEPRIHPLEVFSQHSGLILLNGILLVGIGKIVWYEAFKRLDISKAISLIMTKTLFSVLILVIFFHERLSIMQTVGITLMLIGVYFSMRRQSVHPNLTRYAPDDIINSN